MSQVTAIVPEVDIRDIVLSNNSFGPKEIDAVTRAISDDVAKFGVLREAVQELETREDRSPATSVRLGVCFYLMGRYHQAVETLSKADGGALAHFYLGKTNYALGRHKESLQHYGSSKVAGYGAEACQIASSEVKRMSGDSQGALAVLDQVFGPAEQTPEYLYQRGATVAAIGGNPNEVVALYERAVETQDPHAGALFGLAMENDRRGNDDIAMRLYQRAAECFPTHLGVLLNLGLLYEDRQQYDRAIGCYQRILDVYPDHARARLFLKDAAASGEVYFDDDVARRNDRMAQVLNIPVTDFELSVRSRNCLQKMGVKTLGDLTRTTEQELLASKNFGETSLVEIRDMLASKGLELGQFAHERSSPDAVLDLTSMSPDEQALLERPIADLNLSVRARKCMVRLGLQTLSDLIRKTGDDLLECKNFGVTSLNEVREKLTQLNIKLRGD